MTSPNIRDRWPSDYELDNARIHARATRRHVLKAGAAGAAAIGAGALVGAAVRGQESTPSAAADSTSIAGSANGNATPAATAVAMCVLTPERTEGPYYLDDLLVRSDITEGKAGVPLDLKITVLDVNTCAPIVNAAVDIWHCDANGFYSGFTDKNPGGDRAYQDDGSNPATFLRGVVLTGSDGLAEFRTIYPGWYAGRDIHIHMKVHVGAAAADGTYDGGTTAHTGQLAFEDALTDEIARLKPYANRTTTHLSFAEDNVFGGVGDGDVSFFLTMTPRNAASLADGFTGTINVGVNPAAIQTESGGPGGQGGPPPGGGPGGKNPSDATATATPAT